MREVNSVVMPLRVTDSCLWSRLGSEGLGCGPPGTGAMGTHNRVIPRFSSVASNLEAERRLAAWLKSESTLIYPSVTLANHGCRPRLATRHHACSSLTEMPTIPFTRG